MGRLNVKKLLFQESFIICNAFMMVKSFLGSHNRPLEAENKRGAGLQHGKYRAHRCWAGPRQGCAGEHLTIGSGVRERAVCQITSISMA